MFKLDQKVIRVRVSLLPDQPGVEMLGDVAINEVVTINYMEVQNGCLYLGFEEKNSNVCWNSIDFCPLDEILRKQSEADLSREEKEINEQIPVEA